MGFTATGAGAAEEDDGVLRRKGLYFSLQGVHRGDHRFGNGDADVVFDEGEVDEGEVDEVVEAPL
jgi:hypothetical protein